MALNIVQTIAQYLAPQIVSRLASALHIEPALAQRLVDAALPTVLGAFGGVATTPAGAQRLADTIAAQPSDILDKLTGAIGGANQVSALSGGLQALSGLLGGGGTAQVLSGALAKFAGVPSSATDSILGLVAPAALGSIAKLGAEHWSSAAGITKLFESQKDVIAAALPPQLAASLKSTGLLPQLQGLSSQAQGAARAATGAASSAAANAEATASSGAGLLKWALPVIALLALGWWYFGGQTQNVVEQAKTSATDAVTTAESLKVGAVDVGAAIKTTTDQLRQTLQGVTDGATASAAVPKLQDATAQLDKIDALVAQLPASGKMALAALIRSARPSLNELIAKILAIPGVSAVLKPSVDAVNAKLDKIVGDAG